MEVDCVIANVVSFDGDIFEDLPVIETALPLPPPFLEEGWSKNRPWIMGSIVTVNFRSLPSARGII